MKISSKPMPFFWLNPLTTSIALYLGHEVCSSYFTLYAHLFFKALFPLCSFINSKVWLSCKDFISSCIALIDSLFYSLSIASSKLLGSPPSMNITYSSKGYFVEDRWFLVDHLNGTIGVAYGACGWSITSEFLTSIGSKLSPAPCWSFCVST